MRKTLNVLAWLGLIACLIWAVGLTGQKNAIAREWSSAQRKNDVLQALYDQEKEKAEEAADARAEARLLKQENGELEEKLMEALEQVKSGRDALTALEARMEDEKREAVAAAQEDWERRFSALTEENDAARRQLAAVMSVLAPVPQETEGAPDDLEELPAADSLDAAFALPE